MSDSITDFSGLVDLANERVGGHALAASDEFFAERENLLRKKPAVWDEHRYTDRGKWMDGWETRRAFGRVEGHTHDWCIVRLGIPGVIAAFDVDTSFFRGNFPESCAIETCEVHGDPSVETLLSPNVAWTEVVPRTKLEGNASNVLRCATIDEYGAIHGRPATHVRLKIFPDGGVARLRAWGRGVRDWVTYVKTHGARADFAAAENGGTIAGCNEKFFGPPINMLMPGRSSYMGDGWETRRKRVDGHDWAVVHLAQRAARIFMVEVDTNWFKGNCPESCAIDVLDPAGAEELKLARVLDPARAWRPLIARSKLRPHARHFFEPDPATPSCGSFVRIRIFPDGGISRLRVWADLPGPRE